MSQNWDTHCQYQQWTEEQQEERLEKRELCIIAFIQPRETLSWRTSMALDAKQDASYFSILSRNANPEANSAATG